MFLRPIALAAVALLLAPALARAQAVPFINTGTPTNFDPVIDVVNSGVLHDVQATVSHDRKYVTMTMRPSLSTVTNISTFQFQAPSGGFVGLPNTTPGGGNGNGNNANAPRPVLRPVASPTNSLALPGDQVPQTVNAPSVLTQPGMTKLASL